MVNVRALSAACITSSRSQNSKCKYWKIFFRLFVAVRASGVVVDAVHLFSRFEKPVGASTQWRCPNQLNMSLSQSDNEGSPCARARRSLQMLPVRASHIRIETPEESRERFAR
eukprot:20579-Heterococcus_DN1.PRE.4